MPLAAVVAAEITAPVEVAPMAVAAGPKTVGMPVIQPMGELAEHPEAPRAGHRLTAVRVTLAAVAAAVTSSMETAPILQGHWELQGTMVTEP